MLHTKTLDLIYLGGKIKLTCKKITLGLNHVGTWLCILHLSWYALKSILAAVQNQNLRSRQNGLINLGGNIKR